MCVLHAMLHDLLHTFIFGSSADSGQFSPFAPSYRFTSSIGFSRTSASRFHSFAELRVVFGPLWVRCDRCRRFRSLRLTNDIRDLDWRMTRFKCGRCGGPGSPTSIPATEKTGQAPPQISATGQVPSSHSRWWASHPLRQQARHSLAIRKGSTVIFRAADVPPARTLRQPEDRRPQGHDCRHRGTSAANPLPSKLPGRPSDPIGRSRGPRT